MLSISCFLLFKASNNPYFNCFHINNIRYSNEKKIIFLQNSWNKWEYKISMKTKTKTKRKFPSPCVVVWEYCRLLTFGDFFFFFFFLCYNKSSPAFNILSLILIIKFFFINFPPNISYHFSTNLNNDWQWISESNIFCEFLIFIF